MSATLTHSGNDDISCSIVAKRILIADDSVTIQKAFAMTFAGEDVALIAARSADEAFTLAQRQRPDLIVADGAMPGRTGYDLCAQVRADAALRDVPVYILASAQHPYDEARGQKSGADGPLIKPWDTAAFIQQVGSLSGGGGGVPVRRSTGASIPVVAAVEEEPDYGEISIEASGPETTTSASPPPAPVPAPVPIPRSLTPPLPAAPLGAPPGMRPSLIPGLRPGAVAPARPGTAPMRPLAPAAAAPPRPAAAPAVGRTMIGLPAAGAPIPGVARPSPTMPPVSPGGGPALRAPFAPAPPPAAPPPPAPAPVVPFAPPAAPPPRARTTTPTPIPAPRPRLATPAPLPPPPAPPPAVIQPIAVPSTITQSIDSKLAAISAKGPEYEAIAKLSREIIEQVVWEVVPDLAEAIIREHLEKRGRI
jgi:CheY-like chemotaxis protein